MLSRNMKSSSPDYLQVKTWQRETKIASVVSWFWQTRLAVTESGAEFDELKDTFARK